MNTCKVREQLLAQEPMRPELKTEYERKWDAMFERELATLHTKILTRPGKVRFALVGLIFLGMGFHLAYEGLIALAGLPWLSRWSFFANALLYLAGGALCLRTAIKGSYQRKRLHSLLTGMVCGIVLIQVLVSMLLAGNSAAHPYAGISMLLSSLAFLVVGLGFFLKNALDQSTLKVQAEVLRMQVQLAELNERLSKTAP